MNFELFNGAQLSMRIYINETFPSEFMLHEMTNVVPQWHGSVTTSAPFAHYKHTHTYNFNKYIHLHRYTFRKWVLKSTTKKIEPIHIILFCASLCSQWIEFICTYHWIEMRHAHRGQPYEILSWQFYIHLTLVAYTTQFIQSVVWIRQHMQSFTYWSFQSIPYTFFSDSILAAEFMQCIPLYESVRSVCWICQKILEYYGFTLPTILLPFLIWSLKWLDTLAMHILIYDFDVELWCVMILMIFFLVFSSTFRFVQVPHRELHIDFHAPFYNKIDLVIVVSG